METLGYLASFVMGITLGLMGGGGSILTVPIMVYLFGFSPLVATGNSLFVVGLTALAGSIMYVRKGEIDFKTVVFFAIPSVLGVNISRGFIIQKIPDILIRMNQFELTKEILIMVTFATLMILASYSMIKPKKQWHAEKKPPTKQFMLIALVGLSVGLIAGFVGAGGGFLIIPALVLIAGLSMRIAIGTSLMIITIQSLLGFAGDVARGMSFEWTVLVIVAITAILGIILGAGLAGKIKEQKLKTSFGWFVLIMGSAILLEQFRHLQS